MVDQGTVMRNPQDNDAVVVVAFPGDETLWAGGFILTHPSWSWHIVSMFRGSRPDSDTRFGEALLRLGATGEIVGAPELAGKEISPQSETLAPVLRVLETRTPDLLMSHGPDGESNRLYGRDALGRAVTRLWETERTAVPKLWIFAYDDDNPEGIPYVREDADRSSCHTSEIWQEKQDILLSVYGFAPESFVGKVCPREEGFYCFGDRDTLKAWKGTHPSRERPSVAPPSRKRGGAGRSTTVR